MTVHSSRAPMALEPLVAEAKRRMRRRRSLVALAVVLAGVAGALTFALGPSGPGPGASRAVTAEHVGDLRVSAPRGLRSYDVPVGIAASTPVVGHLLTDFQFPAHTNIWKVLGRWGLAGPAANGVALKLQLWTNPGLARVSSKLHLPLTLKQPWEQEKFKGGRVGYRWGYLRFHDRTYQVMFWSGPNAPVADRTAVLRALRSIRPAR